MNIDVMVHSDNDDWLKRLYDDKIANGERVFLSEGIDIELTSLESAGQGFGTIDLIAGIAIGMGTGIPAGIIANILYDKLMNKGKNQLIIKETKHIITTKEEIHEYVETYLVGDI